MFDNVKCSWQIERDEQCALAFIDVAVHASLRMFNSAVLVAWFCRYADWALLKFSDWVTCWRSLASASRSMTLSIVFRFDIGRQLASRQRPSQSFSVTALSAPVWTVPEIDPPWTTCWWVVRTKGHTMCRSMVTSNLRPLSRASVNGSTRVIYARKFGPKTQN